MASNPLITGIVRSETMMSGRSDREDSTSCRPSLTTATSSAASEMSRPRPWATITWSSARMTRGFTSATARQPSPTWPCLAEAHASACRRERRLAERVGFVPDDLASIKGLGPIGAARTAKSTRNLSIRYRTGTAKSPTLPGRPRTELSRRPFRYHPDGSRIVFDRIHERSNLVQIDRGRCSCRRVTSGWCNTYRHTSTPSSVPVRC